MQEHHQALLHLFVEELENIYSAENQIVDSLPKLIQLASFPELKEALSNHLEETEREIARIKEIFVLLNRKPKSIKSEGMEGLLNEALLMTKDKAKSPMLDAAIISAVQKIEHYEIASYGTLRSFAAHLSLDREIIELIEENLEEEGDADKKLTKIADGSMLSTGVNKIAAERETYARPK